MPPTLTPLALALATTFELLAGFLALVAMRSAYGRARSGYAAAGFALFAVLWADGLLRYWDGRLASLGYGAASGFVGTARHACAGVLVALSLASFLVLASALIARARPDRRLLALCAASVAFATAVLFSPADAVAHTVASLAVAAVAFPHLRSSRRASSVPVPATVPAPSAGLATAAAPSTAAVAAAPATVTAPEPSVAAPPAATASAPAPGVSLPPSPLSARELEVARLLSSGLSYKEIGERLFIAPSTVKTHAIRVYEKMGVDNKVRLAVALKDYE